MSTDTPSPQGHRKLSHGLCHHASGLYVQLRAPLHMNTLISGRGSPHCPLLSCGLGSTPAWRGRRKSKALSTAAKLLLSPWECLAFACISGREMVTKPIPLSLSKSNVHPTSSFYLCIQSCFPAIVPDFRLSPESWAAGGLVPPSVTVISGRAKHSKYLLRRSRGGRGTGPHC